MASAFLDRVSNKALGELLVEKGALSDVQVNEALDFSKQHGMRLGEALVSLGYLSRDALGYAIGEQYGLRPMELQPSMIDEDLVAQFDFELLDAHTMLPLIMVENELVVVVSDPNDQRGLVALSQQFPQHTITPQLGAADQIRRCLEAVRHEPRFSATEKKAAHLAPRELTRFKEVPAPTTPEFVEWLIGLAATHPCRDVLIRDLSGSLQVALTPSANPERSSLEAGLTAIGSWPDANTALVRQQLLQRATPLEHTRAQAAQWGYSVSHEGSEFEFLILMPIVQGNPIVQIRALVHNDKMISESDLTPVPLDPDLEAGKYTVVLYDESVSLEKALAQFISDNAGNHSFVISQQATRCLYLGATAYPAPFVNMVTAAQAAAATCVIFDHPVEYREAIRLLTSTYPPPAVLVCAPLPSHQGGSGSLSPDVEELITRQGAQSVRLMDNAATQDISTRGNN